MSKYGDVELIWDQGAIVNVVGGAANDAAMHAALAFITRAQNGISALGRVRTGDMRDNWDITESGHPLSPEIEVASAMPYTIYQERGTRGSTARPGRFLRFSVGGRIVFAKKTGPIAAGNFIRDAIQGIRLSDFGAY